MASDDRVLNPTACAGAAARALLRHGAEIEAVASYLQGLAPWRSLVWFGGFLATVAMLIAALIYFHVLARL